VAFRRISSVPRSTLVRRAAAPSGAWDSLRKHFLQEALSRDATQRFRIAAPLHPVLARFQDPTALLQFVFDRANHPQEKDSVYRVLIELARREPRSGLWRALLILGLWPGLDAAFNRNIRPWRRQRNDLCSELTLHVCDQIARIDLRRVRRVAATIVRNVARDVERTRLRRRRWEKRTSPLSNREPDDGTVLSQPGPEQVAIALRSLAPELHRDIELLTAVLAGGETQPEAALRLGLSVSKAEKRIQRGLQILRSKFDHVPCPETPTPVACIRRPRSNR